MMLRHDAAYATPRLPLPLRRQRRHWLTLMSRYMLAY